MKQILQNLSDGQILVEDVPVPKNINGNLLIQTRKSLVSSGTEKMLLDFGKGSYIEKARQQPDKVKMVINKISSDGLMPTIDAIKSKLDQPITLGYCNAGIVTESTCAEFKSGDRVISNGNHAEFVRVPKNLCAKIPDNVDDESAAFTVLGAISLQGVRLLNPTIGECVVVFGLGLVGMISVQILIANGCRVLAIDYNSSRCDLAKSFGAESVNLSEGQDIIEIAKSFSRNRGVDAVTICASTKSNELIHQAAEICRKRGRIVLVGVTGLNIRRDDFYKKELTFQVSSSYGPGRYDPSYEEEGTDYPIGFVRWTEQRNFEAILDMLSNNTLNVKPLISHNFEIDDAQSAYQSLEDPKSLGILLNYSRKLEEDINKIENTITINNSYNSYNPLIGEPVVGFIGAGNYSSRTLIPAFKNTDCNLKTLISSGGVSSIYHGKKNSFKNASSNTQSLWDDAEIDTVVIATRHNTHAELILSGLNNNKNIFVEKPLAMSHDEIDSIEQSFSNKNLKLMVGFNRRFSPLIVKMKSMISNVKDSKCFVMTINAGYIPSDHWSQDSKIGGGRIIGEVCHFIDLMRFLAESKINNYSVVGLNRNKFNKSINDTVSINLSFENGSFGVINYFSNGHKSFPKERVEVFCGNKVLQLNNYRDLTGYGWKGFKKTRSLKQDKGQLACAKAFIESLKSSKDSPIPINEILEVSRVAVDISELSKN